MSWIAAVLISGLALTGCGEGVQLIPSDLVRPARLTEQDRQSFLNVCMPMVKSIPAKAEGRVSAEIHNEMKNQVGTLASRLCDCLNTTMEESGSKLQFLMAVTTIERRTNSQGQKVKVGDFPALKTAAMKIGMTEAAYERSRSDVETLINHSANHCKRSFKGY
jgi:triphosphoribosyl-dephospho-CoA synthetase